MKHRATVGALLLLAGGLLSNAQAGQERAKEQKVQAEGTLNGRGLRAARLQVKVGGVRVFADSPGGIRYRAVRHVEGGTSEERRRLFADTSVTVQRQGSAFILKDNAPEQRERGQRGQPSFRLEVEVHVPVRLALDVANGVGNVEASGDFSGVAVRNGVGNVALKQVNVAGEALDVHTDVGDVAVGLRSLPSRRVHAESGVGKVEVRLPERAKASVKMQTGVGNLKSDYSLTSPRRGFAQVGGEMHGDVGGGGVPIEVKAGTGDVRLRKE